MALRRRRRLVWQVSHETRLSPPPQMLLRSLRSCRSSKSARLVRSLILIYRLRQRRLLPVVRRCRLGRLRSFTMLYYEQRSTFVTPKYQHSVIHRLYKARDEVAPNLRSLANQFNSIYFSSRLIAHGKNVQYRMIKNIKKKRS